MVGVGPLDRGDRVELLIVFPVVPELPAFAAAHVGDHEREGVAAGERRFEEAWTIGGTIRGRFASAATAAAAPGPAAAQRRQRVVRRPIGIADAARPLVRLLTEWRSGAADEGDALAVG